MLTASILSNAKKKVPLYGRLDTNLRATTTKQTQSIKLLSWFRDPSKESKNQRASSNPSLEMGLSETKPPVSYDFELNSIWPKPRLEVVAET